MRTENRMTVHAPPEIVFALAADVERWPALLPHYRYVRVLGGAGGRSRLPVDRTVEMSATRSGIPVHWTSTQTLHPEAGQILYRHIRGVTRGMEVAWEIERCAAVVEVRILHQLDRPTGLLRVPGGTWVAGHVFITHIAAQTLAGIARHAEASARGQVR